MEDVILEEFDQEWHEAKIREESWQEGREQLLLELIQKKRKKGLTDREIAVELEMTEDQVREIVGQQKK